MEQAAKVVAIDEFGPATNTSQNLQQLGFRAWRGVQYVAELELKLKEAKAKLRELQEQRLPELMLQEGVSEFQIENRIPEGIAILGTIQLQSVVHASIPKYRREEAVAYLRDQGYGDHLIKTIVTVVFGKGEHSEAMEFAKSAKEDGFTVELAETIHGSTLKSWAKKEVPKAPQLDLDLLGVYVGNKAVVVGQPEEEDTSGKD